MMHHCYWKSSIALFCVLLVSSGSQAQLISNGSFESPSLGSLPSQPIVTGWTGTGGSAGVTQNVAGGFLASGGAVDGTQFAYLQGAGAGIYQQVSLAANTSYTLNFSTAGRYSGPVNPSGGNASYSVLINNVLLASGSTTTGMAFTNNSASFISTIATQYEVKFLVTGTLGDPDPDQTVLLDFVSLVSNGVVPEPGSLALIGLAIPAVGLVLRRRKL